MLTRVFDHMILFHPFHNNPNNPNNRLNVQFNTVAESKAIASNDSAIDKIFNFLARPQSQACVFQSL